MIRNTKDIESKGDIFGRSAFANIISDIIETQGKEGAILGLNAGWGEGKTRFINDILIPHLQSTRKIKTVYIDASLKSYEQSPFLILCSEILNLLGGIEGKTSDLTKDIMKLAGKILIRYALKGEIPILEDSEKGIEDDLSKFVEKQIGDYLKNEKSISDFKNKIASLAITEEKPIVVIIDEIDRCRPDFGVNLIETIRHFFGIDNITFIVAFNKTQIEDYIKITFGTKNAEIFLEKFFDIILKLPVQNYSTHHNSTIKIYIEYLFSIAPYNQLVNFQELFTLLCEIHNLNFRQVNTLINQLLLAKKFDGAQGFSSGIIYVIFLEYLGEIRDLNFPLKEDTIDVLSEKLKLKKIENKDKSDVEYNINYYYENFKEVMNKIDPRRFWYYVQLIRSLDGDLTKIIR